MYKQVALGIRKGADSTFQIQTENFYTIAKIRSDGFKVPVGFDSLMEIFFRFYSFSGEDAAVELPFL